MYNTIGERITYCRNILGISRPNLVKQMGNISIASVSRWELDTVTIPEPQITRLAEYFNSHGILVSIEWLQNGTGTAPINNNFLTLAEYNFDDAAYLTLTSLKSTFKDLQIHTLTSSFFEPILSFGDYIAGVLTKRSDIFNKKECFVVQQKSVVAGIYDYQNNQLINCYNQKLNLDPEFTIGEVVCSIKRC